MAKKTQGNKQFPAVNGGASGQKEVRGDTPGVSNKANLWRKAILVLAVAAAVISVGYRIVKLFASPLQTQTVLQSLVYDAQEADLFVVREELLVPPQSGGAILPAVQNGERVGKGEAIAMVFQNQMQAQQYMELQQLQKTLARYDSSRQATAINLDIQKLDTEIDVLFCSLLDRISGGNLENYTEIEEQMVDKLTVRQVAVSGMPEESASIKDMRGRVQTLTQSCVPSSYVRAQEAGYFVADTDGVESAAVYADVKSLSVSDIDALQNRQPVPVNAYGKLITSYNWYFVTAIDSNRAAQLGIGNDVKILFDEYADGSLTVTLAHIGIPENGRTPLIFSCNRMNRELSEMRLENARIVINEYKGIKISRDAVRMKDGETGAYILRGNLINFRRLDVVFENADCVVAVEDEENTSKTNHVILYDEVILRGKDLKDEQVVQ